LSSINQANLQQQKLKRFSPPSEARGPCALQISLISLLMDCPTPGSVSRGLDVTQTPLHLQDFFHALTAAMPEHHTKRSVSLREAHSSQLGYPVPWALGMWFAVRRFLPQAPPGLT